MAKTVKKGKDPEQSIMDKQMDKKMFGGKKAKKKAKK